MCLFTPKPIKLSAVTSKLGLVEMFPIVPASDRQPAWMENMPATYEMSAQCPIKGTPTNIAPTIKRCFGIKNLLNKGFILRAWEDVSIVVFPDGAVSFVGAGSGNAAGTKHDSRQIPAEFGDKIAIKLHSPWSFYSDKTEYMFMPASYHNNLDKKGATILTGLVNYEHMEETNVFLLAERKAEPYEIFIRAGTPLVHIVPMTSKKVILEQKFDPNHCVFKSRSFFLMNPYKRFLQAIGK